MKIGKATYVVIAVVVLVFASAMLFFRLHIPNEAKLLAVVKQVEQQYGADNPKVIAPLSLLSSVYVISDHPEKAADIYRRIVAIDIKHAGPESALVVSSKHQLAILLDTADEIEQADSLYVEIHKLEQRLTEKTGNSVTNKAGGKDRKNYKPYKPVVRQWIETRIASLRASQEQDEQDSDMLQRYQRRLKMLD